MQLHFYALDKTIHFVNPLFGLNVLISFKTQIAFHVCLFVSLYFIFYVLSEIIFDILNIIALGCKDGSAGDVSGLLHHVIW